MKQHINYRGFWTMLALMFGFTIFSASVMSGAQLAQSLETWKGIIAIIAGNIFLAIYGGLMAWISNKKQHNLDGVLKTSFGKKGAVIPSMIMVLTQTGWFGVGIAMIAIPLANYAGVSAWIFVFIAGLLVIATAFFGLKSLTIISMIAVPLVIILGLVTISLAAGYGDYQAFDHNSSKSTITSFGAISVVIGTFISGATFVPNFAVNAKNSKIAISTTALAFFVGNGLMIGFGFIAQLFIGDQVTGFTSITESLSTILSGAPSLIVIGLIILILNIWTTNDSGLYSISLGLSHWIKIPKFKGEIDEDGQDHDLDDNRKNRKITWITIPKRIWVVIFGLIGTAASLWIYEHFVDFLTAMNQFVPPIGAIVIINHLLKQNETSLLNRWGFNWETIIVLGLATGIVFIPELKENAPLISFAIALVLYGSYIGVEKYLLKMKRTN